MHDIHDVATARAVATALGEGWSLRRDPEAHNLHLDGPDGLTIWFRFGGWQNEGRIEVHSGAHELNKHLAYNQGWPKITVARGRLPGDIAKEIIRRLLPGYRELHAEVMDRKRQNDEWHRQRDAFHARLLTALGGIGEGRTNPRGERDSIHIGNYSRGGNIEVNSDSIKLDLRLDNPDEAVRLAVALREILGGEQ
jgi:hypothetical protein